MFREMRRKKQLLSKEETIEILNKCTAGVLGVNGDDGYPYTVPISYTYKDDKIYFHSALSGHKVDAIKKDDKVTLSVIEKDEVMQETFTTHFRSVSIFGRARILTDDVEKRQALQFLAEKYSPDFIKEGDEEIQAEWKRVLSIVIDIEHMTGKEAIELVRERK